MNARDRMLEQLRDKLEKRALELDRDVSRLKLANKMVEADNLFQAVGFIKAVVTLLEG